MDIIFIKTYGPVNNYVDNITTYREWTLLYSGWNTYRYLKKQLHINL